MMQKKSDKTVEQFMSLYRGYEHAHGQHQLNGQPDETGKVLGRASTKGTGAGEPQYLNHLNGAGTSLGLIPLMADNTCWFGAIDIDIKSPDNKTPILRETHESLESRVRKMELPLVVCKSKSGGAHLYLFGEKPLGAKLLVAKLSEFAVTLGYGGVEIFPKQTTRVNEQDRGNWINISYYGALSKEGTVRYAIRNGKPIMKLEDFVKYASMMRLTNESLQEVKLKLNDSYNDAPPCLQHIATYGLEQGGRNSALINFGVYFKQKYPDSWQEKLGEANQDIMKPPVPSSELAQIIRNANRKDYFYTCKQPPICNHCDKKLCAKREFGIDALASGGDIFPVDNLTKCVSKNSVRWYLEHQGMRIEITTEELLNQSMLQKVYLERFNILIIPGKNAKWMERIKELMATCDVVYDPEDASSQGQFENLLDNFFTANRPARNRDEIIKGNCFAENGRIYFRSEDLFKYLTIHHFKNEPHDTWSWLKQMGADNHQIKVKGKNIRVWSLPAPDKFDNSPIALPTEVEQEEL